jgi:glycosyltransferase involved in cell wall biosynthesis
MKSINQISAFFPAYNEEKNIEKTILKANDILKKITKNYEILIINDGSTDKTKKIIEKLSKKNNKIKIIAHEKNKGYGASLISGFYNCKYEWIAFTDSDGQFDFSEITKFISTQKKTGADLVIGYYKKRRVPFLRKLNTTLWSLLIKTLFKLKVKDLDCAFKLIRKEVIDSIPKLESQRGAFISTELLVKTKNFKIIEIPVTHYPSINSQSTGATPKVIIESFKDLFKLRKKLK